MVNQLEIQLKAIITRDFDQKLIKKKEKKIRREQKQQQQQQTRIINTWLMCFYIYFFFFIYLFGSFLCDFISTDNSLQHTFGEEKAIKIPYLDYFSCDRNKRPR